ncbi:hypothetical protein OK016_25780 [Vibrio chagasii]|nr:hypothetical protein [Vibrio chagasii]
MMQQRNSLADLLYAIPENTIGSTDIKQCEKSLNLFNIYSIGWEDEFNRGYRLSNEKIFRTSL